jgi:lipopolysaccharide transport system permease protein
MYDFVVGATNKAMDGITSNAALLKKTYVSKYMFPLAKVTSCMVDYVLSLGALLIVLIFTGSPFYWTMLLFPLITLEAYIFACGMGFFLAQMHVFFRDTRYIYNAFTTAWMYASAIFYPVLIYILHLLNPKSQDLKCYDIQFLIAFQILKKF